MLITNEKIWFFKTTKNLKVPIIHDRTPIVGSFIYNNI